MTTRSGEPGTESIDEQRTAIRGTGESPANAEEYPALPRDAEYSSE